MDAEFLTERIDISKRSHLQGIWRAYPSQDSTLVYIPKYYNCSFVIYLGKSKNLRTYYYYFIRELEGKSVYVSHNWRTGRVETKIFVFVFSRKFIFAFCENIIQKYTKITKIFAKIDAKIFAKTKIEAKIFAKTKIEAKIFAKTKISTNTYAKILHFGIIKFWPDFFTIFCRNFRDNFCEN
jgi:hypothetical protein